MQLIQVFFPSRFLYTIFPFVTYSFNSLLVVLLYLSFPYTSTPQMPSKCRYSLLSVFLIQAVRLPTENPMKILAKLNIHK